MGIATAYHLARRGVRVLVLEQFGLIHDAGAHGGQTRIIRKAYFEHPDYVPLLQRAYANWAALEAETGLKVYYETGLVYFGPQGDELLGNSKASAQQYGLKMNDLGMADAKREYPIFSAIPDDWASMFEPEAGFLMVERCLRGYAAEAMKHGAVIRAHERVLEWTAKDGTIQVCTEKETYEAEKMVVTAGAWTSRLLHDLNVPLKITRQVLGWVRPKGDWKPFMLGQCPCWFVSDPAQGLYYGKPIIPDSIPMGFKVGAHHHGTTVDPDHVDRAITPDDEADFRVALEKYIPSANGDLLSAKTCLYANSPDGDFIIDHLPGQEQVIFACGFSGHGFKFASVIGEVLADMAEKGQTDWPVGFLRLR